MRAESQNPRQAHTVFGAASTQQRHDSESNLPAPGRLKTFSEAISALKSAMVDELLKALRSALSLRR
jgi:hypothetical protein